MSKLDIKNHIDNKTNETIIHSIVDNENFKKIVAKEFKRVWKSVKKELTKKELKLPIIVKFDTIDFIDTYNNMYTKKYEGGNYNELDEAYVLLCQDKKTPQWIKDNLMDILVISNMGLIIKSINKWVTTWDDGKISVPDLIEEMKYVTLCKTLPTYKINTGYRFSSYNMTCMHFRLCDIFGASVSIEKINNGEKIMGKRGGINDRRSELSIDKTVSSQKGGKDMSIVDNIADKNLTPEETYKNNNMRDIIIEACNELEPIQKFIVYCRYNFYNTKEKMTQKLMAEYLGMSQANVSKKEEVLLKRLKSILNAKGVNKYEYY